MVEASIPDTHGFPTGYFCLRSLATGRLLDVASDKSDDGTPVILWPAKETSLVETMRDSEADNQVFFIDTSGHLCSRLSGHAIDVEDDRLVLRHRRPVTNPYPNRFSHSLPIFTFLPKTHQITVTFAVDPIFHASDDALKAAGARPVTPTRGTAPRSAPTTPTHTTFSTPGSTYVLASIPKRAPPSLLTSFSSFISENTTALLGHAPKSTPEAVFNGHIDLREDEVLEEERGEAAEVDDSPDHKREVRVVREHEGATGSAVSRRQWEVLTLRENRALTGAM